MGKTLFITTVYDPIAEKRATAFEVKPHLSNECREMPWHFRLGENRDARSRLAYSARSLRD
jgi:hypothetical protein